MGKAIISACRRNKLRIKSEKLRMKKKIKQLPAKKNPSEKTDSRVAALQQEVAFLNSIIETIPNMIFLKEAKELRFVRFNKAGQKLLGYSQKSLLGKNDYDFFPKNEADFFTYKDREVLKSKHVIDIPEETIQTQKLGQRILHTKKSTLFDLKGKPAYLLGISEDITEKKEAAARLAESKKQLHLALKVAGIGVWSWHPQRDMLFWDENMFHIFGVPPTVGGLVNYAVFSNCLHLRDRDRVNSAVQNALKKETEYNDTFAIAHPEKGEREIAVRCSIDRDGEGNAISMTGTNLDITEQQQKHTLEIKSEMISMVSHELRTPLHTVKESISLVLEGLTGQINGEQRDVLDTAKQCIDRLTRLINNVLDFQKMEAGIIELDHEKQNINELIQEVAEIEKPSANKKNIALELNLCDEPLFAEIDSDKIVQVLTNLIHNAVKFTEKGTISLATQKNNQSVLITVTDSGIGFSEADAKKIFFKFGQTNDSRKMHPQGTGLGLAISKKIIDQHQGKIWAESNKPLGSSFYVLLPINQNTSCIKQF